MAACRSNRFQFGCKYGVALTAALVLLIVLSEDVPGIRSWRPVFFLANFILLTHEMVSLLLRLADQLQDTTMQDIGIQKEEASSASATVSNVIKLIV